jgi:hypothetical protein
MSLSRLSQLSDIQDADLAQAITAIQTGSDAADFGADFPRAIA